MALALEPGGRRREDGRVAEVAASALRAALLLAAVALLLARDQGGWAFVGAFALALVPRLARLRPAFDAAVVAALALNAAGYAFGLWRAIAWFDEATHLITPLLIAPVAYIALAKADGVPRTAAPGWNARLGRFVVTAALGLALAALWELFEWGLDGAAGTDFSPGYTDTLLDLLMDSLGAVLAGGLMAWRRW